MEPQIRIYPRVANYPNRLVQMFLWKGNRWFILNTYMSVEEMIDAKEKLDRLGITYKRIDMPATARVGYCRKKVQLDCHKAKLHMYKSFETMYSFLVWA